MNEEKTQASLDGTETLKGTNLFFRFWQQDHPGKKGHTYLLNTNIDNQFLSLHFTFYFEYLKFRRIVSI